ncbi:hypothetical protein SAMN06265222_1255 [Neorhodopirellula lusitana]|uniref:Lipoprotein n=1 Tax=Neorhodopirellula lusitana TaxID=445327 RepID=A0ABY1QT90_9BACT|nr:hypothetical protein SAMN06265222_1255 [Neorhodopirellula lusitana]
MNTLRKSSQLFALLLFAVAGCGESYGVPPVDQLAVELRNPEYRWKGPCSREDRIPVLHAARALACIGDDAVPTLLDAAKDPEVDIISVHDALSEIGLPVSLFYDDLMARDVSQLEQWWHENMERTRGARNEHRSIIGLPPVRVQ